MIPFEKLLCPSQPREEEVKKLFAEVFGTPAGQKLITTLCAVQNPLCHTPGMTEHEHGRAEVVATLYRYGAQTAFVPGNTTTPPTKK